MYLGEIAFPLVLFGVVSAAFSITKIPGAVTASALLQRLKPRAVMSLCSYLAAAGIVWMGFAKSAYGLIGMAAACFASEVLEIASSGYLHHRIDSAARATVDSAASLIKRGLSAVVGLLFGFLAGRLPIISGFLALGVICLSAASAFTLSWLGNKKTD